ncbi:hypothetical protein QYF36_003170 [Acer negundo]|nr:hypothetical protein QYF36_003170 [Acer negundo]
MVLIIPRGFNGAGWLALAETLGVDALALTELFTVVGDEIDEKLGFGSNSVKTFYGGFHIGAFVGRDTEFSEVVFGDKRSSDRLAETWRERHKQDEGQAPLSMLIFSMLQNENLNLERPKRE